MRFVLFSQRFEPENTVINQVSELLVRDGHEVTVMTGLPNAPVGSIFDGYGYFKRLSEEWRGVKVRRNWLIPRGDGSGPRLAVNYLSFAFAATAMLPRLRGARPDVLVVNQATPITQALPAIAYKRMTGAPLAMWIHDLWPDSLQSSGAISSAQALRKAGRFVEWVYGQCDLIFAQSEAMRDVLAERGVPESKLRYLPNLLDDAFAPVGDGEISDELGLDLGDDPFVVMFAGALGRSHGLPSAIHAARDLKDRGHSDVHWVFVGDGSNRAEAERLTAELGVDDVVHFVGYRDPADMPGIYSCADLLLVHLVDEPIYHLTVPLKIHSYLASGRPIVCGVPGEGSRIVTEAGAGFTFESENAEDLAGRVVAAKELSATERRSLGRAGRSYFDEHYSQLRVMERFLEGIGTITG